MPQPQKKDASMADAWRQNFYAATWIAAMMALPVEVIIRKYGTMGERYVRPFVLLGGLVIIALLPCLMDDVRHATPLYLLGGVTLFSAMIHNGSRKGTPVCHSLYKGDVRFGKDYYGEAFWVIAAGIGITASGVSFPLAAYCVLAGLAMVFNDSVWQQSERVMLRNLADLEIEQRYIARKYEGLNNGSYY